MRIHNTLLTTLNVDTTVGSMEVRIYNGDNIEEPNKLLIALGIDHKDDLAKSYKWVPYQDLVDLVQTRIDETVSPQ